MIIEVTPSIGARSDALAHFRGPAGGREAHVEMLTPDGRGDVHFEPVGKGYNEDKPRHGLYAFAGTAILGFAGWLAGGAKGALAGIGAGFMVDQHRWNGITRFPGQVFISGGRTFVQVWSPRR